MARRRRRTYRRAVARRSPNRSATIKSELAVSTARQATTRAKDKGRISTKVYAGVGAGSALGGYLFGEYMEDKAWMVGKKTDARLVVGPVSMGVGGVLMIRKKTRQGMALIAAVLLLFGGVGVLASFLWSEYLSDEGMYSDTDHNPNMLDMNQNTEGIYEYADDFEFNEA